MKSYEIYVKGRVQGVGYRYYIAKHARMLLIKGNVRNIENGDVKIIAVCEEDKFNEFLHFVRKGPTMSWIYDVKITEYSQILEFGGFSIEH